MQCGVGGSLRRRGSLGSVALLPGAGAALRRLTCNLGRGKAEYCREDNARPEVVEGRLGRKLGSLPPAFIALGVPFARAVGHDGEAKPARPHLAGGLPWAECPARFAWPAWPWPFPPLPRAGGMNAATLAL